MAPPIWSLKFCLWARLRMIAVPNSSLVKKRERHLSSYRTGETGCQIRYTAASAKALQIGINHQLNELRKRRAWFPAQFGLGSAVVTR